MNKKLDTYDDNDGYDRVNENDDDDNNEDKIKNRINNVIFVHFFIV